MSEKIEIKRFPLAEAKLEAEKSDKGKDTVAEIATSLEEVGMDGFSLWKIGDEQ